MKRLLTAVFILTIIFSCTKNEEPEYYSENFNLVKLADGVFACIHKIGGKAICNIGIVDNGKETVIFDTFLSPSAAKEIFDVVKHYNLSPIKFVVNSHFHNDHIRGNQLFNEEVEIISTTKTKELIEKWEPEQIEFENKYAPGRLAYYDSLLTNYSGNYHDSLYNDIQMWRPYYQILSNSKKEVRTTLPGSTIDSIKIISGPDRNIELISKGEGHTESDLILYLPDEGILFSGDLVFNNCHPYMGDGFPDKWLEYLDFIVSINPKVVVPGHGGVGNKDQLTAMKDYITAIDSITTDMIENGKTKDDIDSIKIPQRFGNWMFSRFFEYNISSSLNEKLKM